MKPPVTPFDPTTWLVKRRLEQKLEQKLDQKLEQGLEKKLEKKLQTLAPIHSTTIPEEVTSFFDYFDQFIHHLVNEQLKKPENLVKLNPSRRESLGRCLSELCRLPEPQDPQAALRNFIRIDRSETEHEALKQLFKQIALVQIGKALLLKSWGMQANASFERADLKDLTAAVERGLRPFMHLQTSTAQLIQQNFYSWYKLDEKCQAMLWDLLERIDDLNAAREWLLDRATQLSVETLGERDRYSKGFYQNLWKSIQKHKLLELRFKNHYGFCPTLRDGTFMENSPQEINWIGFEPLSFELLFCEIRFLWQKPRNPQLWLKGSGLEMSMEQQTTMLLTHSGKQNILQQMDSISSCEIALIAEESLIRTQSRSLAAQALRKEVDQHSILKKLKQPASTRGMYQSCQALEKLRQGGLLIWAREELLTEASGKPALHFVLNQAKILLIADFTALECESSAIKRDIPKALYLLKKESDIEARKGHRPLMIKAYGALKTEADVSILFDRVLSLVQKSDQAFPLEPFQIHARVSPMDQREWEQHWFNPTDDQLVDQIEDLKRNSTPLGQLAVVRTVHPTMDFHSQQEPSLFNQTPYSSSKTIQSGQTEGFYAWVESSKNGNEIYTAEQNQLPDYMKQSHTLFWIAPFQAQWSAPLQVLIRSQLTRDWFNYSVERKKGAWILRESDLKAIPIPKHLSQVLTEPRNFSDEDHPILSLVATEPGQALRSLENLPENQEGHALRIKAFAFISASHVLQQLEVHQGTLFSLISPEEQIIYPKFFRTVLPEQESTSIGQHPLIRFTATLTNHMAIQEITQVKFPSPGILLTTSKGLTQQLFIQDAWLRERSFELLQDLKTQVREPTWEEICLSVRLPRNPAQAQAMSQQILKAYAQEKMKRKELNHLIGACLLNPHPSQSKVGLLQ